MSEQAKQYRVIDAPANGATGQDCGTFRYAELPERLRRLIDADPDAAEWSAPALSDGDSGDELDDLTTVVRLIPFAVGQRVESDLDHDDPDFDRGMVSEVNGDQVTVNWDSLVSTTQHYSLLRPESK